MKCQQNTQPSATHDVDTSSIPGVQLPPLRGATAYTLRVRARNEAGLSEAAEVTVRTGPTVPGWDWFCLSNSKVELLKGTRYQHAKIEAGIWHVKSKSITPYLGLSG